MKINGILPQNMQTQTKQDNDKMNLYKRIGTSTGLVGGMLLSRTEFCKKGAAALSAKIKPKASLMSKNVILGLGIAALTLILRGLGTIPDVVINKHQKDVA